MPELIGAGETQQEAMESFLVFLDSAYTAYLEGKLGGKYDKPGRPPKNNVEIHVKVRETTKSALKDLASHIDCSQGEAIDYLYSYYVASNSGYYALADTRTAKRSTKATRSSTTGRVTTKTTRKAAYTTPKLRKAK